LALLQQIEPVQNQCQVVVLCHTKQLAFQISKDFILFAKYLPKVAVSVFFGGMNIKINQEALKSEVPNIVISTPGRLSELVKKKSLDLSNVRHVVLEQCDKLLDSLSEK
jgi:ATP-dependent RNA helicase UAP56/SUB2